MANQENSYVTFTLLSFWKKNALKYWDSLSNIADDVNFTDVIEEYQAGFFLHPKKLAWSGSNDEELLVNLQENNGLQFTAIAGSNLFDHYSNNTFSSKLFNFSINGGYYHLF